MTRVPIAGLACGLIPNALVLASWALAVWLWTAQPDTYYLAVQEDGLLEWSSFWAFAVAGCLFGLGAVRAAPGWRQRWFLFGLSAFCLFVALEEISWGQRIFGYRPPEYFLEFNYQQELNLHNVIDTSLRKAGLFIVLIGYGVALPLLGRVGPLDDLFRRSGIRVPPLSLAPAFALTAIVQLLYPIKFTGEWVELMLGIGFVFAAAREATPDRTGETVSDRHTLIHSFVGLLLIMVLGALSTAVTHGQRRGDPRYLEAARVELTALGRDLGGDRLDWIGCGVHRRLFTLATRDRADDLFSGNFVGLVAQGLPGARAAFFLDPWDTAYWLRFGCADDGRPEIAYVYSFGPNRRRDSTRAAIGGDDLVYLLRGKIGRLSPATAPETPD